MLRLIGWRLKTLPPVYDWFTQGFVTADLEEAKTLLEELK